ncbi:MAG: hypothetical protein KC776_36805 [Myxococcales bacterium]|nr:hypothetical protein [Myxococcales bacterium]MCB9580907.1 hypothetical protein [Polyangiaceae bacterium]
MDQRAAQRRPGIVPLRTRILGLIAVLILGVGCPCVRSAVNASPGLRWWLFSNFGAQRMCPEMLKRGAPLKLDPAGNTIGRFFPTTCTHEVHDETQSVVLRFGGTGYAWTPLAGRVGFSMDAAMEYSFDFKMTEDAVYVWATNPRVVSAPAFKIGSVENKVVDIATKSPVGYMANTFGSQIVSYQLFQGFTVVHGDEGDEFTLGRLNPPARPPRPFDTSEEKFVFANETTEVRANQVDFLGPFEVADDDQAIFLRVHVAGPAIDVMVFPRGTADLWRESLQLGNPLGPPSAPPIAGYSLQPGAELKQKIKLPRGQYMVVLDNSAAVGVVKPPWNPLSVVGGSTAVVSYVAELGDSDDEF